MVWIPPWQLAKLFQPGLKRFIAITDSQEGWAHRRIQQWSRNTCLPYYFWVVISTSILGLTGNILADHAKNRLKETSREFNATIAIYGITLNAALSEMKCTTSLLIHLVCDCAPLVDYPASPTHYLRLHWIYRTHFLRWKHYHQRCPLLHLLAMELAIELKRSPVNLV